MGHRDDTDGVGIINVVVYRGPCDLTPTCDADFVCASGTNYIVPLLPSLRQRKAVNKFYPLWQQLVTEALLYFRHAHFIPIVGVGKRGAY